VRSCPSGRGMRRLLFHAVAACLERLARRDARGEEQLAHGAQFAAQVHLRRWWRGARAGASDERRLCLQVRKRGTADQGSPGRIWHARTLQYVAHPCKPCVVEGGGARGAAARRQQLRRQWALRAAPPCGQARRGAAAGRNGRGWWAGLGHHNRSRACERVCGEEERARGSVEYAIRWLFVNFAEWPNGHIRTKQPAPRSPQPAAKRAAQPVISSRCALRVATCVYYCYKKRQRLTAANVHTQTGIGTPWHQSPRGGCRRGPSGRCSRKSKIVR
jgi:hypothetical protein